MGVSTIFNRLFIGMLIPICTLVVTGCQTGTIKGSSKSSGTTSFDIQLTATEQQALADAQRRAQKSIKNEDYSEALNQLLYVLQLKPNLNTAKQAVDLAQKSKDALGLIQASAAWLQFEPTNYAALEAAIIGHLMQIDYVEELRESSFDKALEHIDTLRRAAKNDTVAFYQLQGLNRLYLRQATLALWQALSQTQPNSPLGWSLLADAYLRVNQATGQDSFLKQSEQPIDVALRLQDDFGPAIDLKVDWLNMNDRSDEVPTFLQSLLITNKQNRAAYRSLAEYYYNAKEYYRSLKLAKQWSEQIPDSIQAKYYIAASHYGNQQFEEAYKRFSELTGSDYRPQLTYFYCGDTAERIGKLAEAEDCYRKIAPSDYWFDAQRRLIALMIYDDRSQEALQRLDSLAQELTANEREQVIELKGTLLTDLDRQQEALDWLYSNIDDRLMTARVPMTHLALLYEQSTNNDWVSYTNAIAEKVAPSIQQSWYLRAIDWLARTDQKQAALIINQELLNQQPNNPTFRYSMALTYGLLDKLASAETILRQLLSEQPENANYQNALGYTLAQQNKELDYALELVQNALAINPNSAATRDSLGWIYFKLGRLDEAEEELKQAFNQESVAEILAHYLEVLVRNNKRQEAQTLLERWWENVNQDPFILEVIERTNLNTPDNIE